MTPCRSLPFQKHAVLGSLCPLHLKSHFSGHDKNIVLVLVPPIHQFLGHGIFAKHVRLEEYSGPVHTGKYDSTMLSIMTANSAVCQGQNATLQMKRQAGKPKSVTLAFSNPTDCIEYCNPFCFLQNVFSSVLQFFGYVLVQCHWAGTSSHA